MEEPLAPQDFDGYARLRQTSAVPIATGEALYTVFDFKRLLDVGGVDVIQPDLSLCGGFWQGRRIADLAETHHVRLSRMSGGRELASQPRCISSPRAHPIRTHRMCPGRPSSNMMSERTR